jgi:hypothetical protein
MTGAGNEAQIRIVAEQLVDAAITKVSAKYMQPPKAEIPAPLKWAGGIIAAMMTAFAILVMTWGVNTLADLKETVTRIDERQRLSGDSTEKRLASVEGRVSRLEGHSPDQKGSGE